MEEKYRKEFIVDLTDINNLRDFNSNILNKIESDVDAVYGSQIFDAKSLLGLIAICTQKLRIVLHSDDETELKLFNEICEKYEVK